MMICLQREERNLHWKAQIVGVFMLLLLLVSEIEENDDDDFVRGRKVFKLLRASWHRSGKIRWPNFGKDSLTWDWKMFARLLEGEECSLTELALAFQFHSGRTLAACCAHQFDLQLWQKRISEQVRRANGFWLNLLNWVCLLLSKWRPMSDECAWFVVVVVECVFARQMCKLAQHPSSKPDEMIALCLCKPTTHKLARLWLKISSAAIRWALCVLCVCFTCFLWIHFHSTFAFQLFSSNSRTFGHFQCSFSLFLSRMLWV